MSLLPVSTGSVDPLGAVRRRRGASVARAALGLALLTVMSSRAVAVPPGSAPGAPGPSSPSLKELTRGAELIFRGTVLRLGAANLEVVAPDAGTAIVRVDEIVHSPGALDDFTGREVTLFQREPLELKAGDRRTFFTTLAMSGETLGLAELGHVAGSPRETKARVAAARRQILKESLADRLAASDLAISGRIASAKPAQDETASRPLTEHDPLWWEAVIEVSGVLHGAQPGKTLAVWFPTSQDAMWALAPKPTSGREGIWLLHRYEVEGKGPVYAVLAPQDFLTPDETKVAEKWVKP